nr:hypothetical protein [Candidatus Sigynarchaeota archaeon]
FIDPMAREQEIDRQYSSASGYHDLYKDKMEPKANMRDQNLAGALKRQPVSKFIGERCAMDDGAITAEDERVYQCPNCQACFHHGCARLVLDFQNGICPACGVTLDRTL